MTTELARSLSTWPADSTSAESSPPGLMLLSETSRSGPTTCCHPDSSDTWCWPHQEESWIMRRPGESTWEARFLDSSSEKSLLTWINDGDTHNLAHLTTALWSQQPRGLSGKNASFSLHTLSPCFELSKPRGFGDKNAPVLAYLTTEPLIGNQVQHMIREGVK